MKLIIAQTGFLGDVILSTPVIAALKSAYPSAGIWMLTSPEAEPLVRRDPLLEGIITFDKKGKDRGIGGLMRLAGEISKLKCSKGFLLHRSFRTALLMAYAGTGERTAFRDGALAFLSDVRVERPKGTHDVERRLSILSREPVPAGIPDDLRLFAPAPSECAPKVREWLESEAEYAVLVPGSEWETKRWHARGYREAAEHILRLGMRVLVCGARGERAWNEQVSTGLDVCDMTGATTLEDFLCLIEKASLLVCNDSMAMHAGSAFKIPTVAVFCATSPSFGFGPWRNRAVIVEKSGLSCRPCRRHGSRRCPTGTEKCMRDLPSGDVIRAVDSILGRQK